MVIGELDRHAVAECVELWRQAGLTRPWNDPEADLRRALDGSTSTVLAATDDAGRVMGTVMVGQDGHRGWLYYLAVAADRRRRGVGRQLVRAAEAWLARRGVPKVNLMVRSSNAEVLGFYAELGYTDGDVTVLGRFLDAADADPHT